MMFRTSSAHASYNSNLKANALDRIPLLCVNGIFPVSPFTCLCIVEATSQRSAVHLSSDATQRRQRRSSETLSILDLSRRVVCIRKVVVAASGEHPMLDSCWNGHATLGLFRAYCFFGRINTCTNLICNPFGSKSIKSALMAVMVMFTNNKRIACDKDLHSYHILQFHGNRPALLHITLSTSMSLPTGHQRGHALRLPDCALPAARTADVRGITTAMSKLAAQLVC